MSLPVQLNDIQSTVKGTHWNDWQNHCCLQQQRIFSEAKKTQRGWFALLLSGLILCQSKWFYGYKCASIYISFCIKAGSAKKKAKPILWTDVIKPRISVGFFVPMVTMTSDYSAYLVVEANDSSSPLLTHFYSSAPACTSWDIRSQLAFQWDMKEHLLQTSLPLFLPPTFLSVFPAITGKGKTLLKWKGVEEEISGI